MKWRYEDYRSRLGSRLRRRGYELLGADFLCPGPEDVLRPDLIGYYGPNHPNYDGIQRVVTLANADHVTVKTLRSYSACIFDMALERLDQDGLQHIVCLTALATHSPPTAVLGFVQRKFLFRLPSIELPVIVDLQSGQVHLLGDVPVWGDVHVDWHVAYARRLFTIRQRETTTAGQPPTVGAAD